MTELAAGYHNGTLTSWKVLTPKTEKGIIYKFVARCHIEDRDGNVFDDVKADILLAGNRGPNQVQIDSLKESLGWSGESLKELQDGDYSGKTFTFKVEHKVGRDNTDYGMQVTWINRPRGYRKMSDSDLDQADQGWKSITESSLKVEKDDPVPFRY